MVNDIDGDNDEDDDDDDDNDDDDDYEACPGSLCTNYNTLFS